VAPANLIPPAARANGAKIIEINPVVSEYTHSVTDVFLKEKATTAMERLMEKMNKK
jgi:NAD-dependent deacetylase